MDRLNRRFLIAGLTLCMTLAAVADELVIQSFDSKGQLTFSEVPDAVEYRVEWACSPDGPWTNSWKGLDPMVATGSGSVTCSVPMCYRVVATVMPTPEGMVLIPSGSFSMGYQSGDPDENPVHEVFVSAFFMDRYEVTKSKWNQVAYSAQFLGYDISMTDGSGKAPNHPVQGVTWFECVKWCNARSELEGRTPCYTVDNSVYRTGYPGSGEPECNWMVSGYRLPTEAEWEKAARGGLNGQRFPWGEIINHDYVNYLANGNAYSFDTSPYTSDTYHPDYADGGEPYTSPVGSFSANGYGLYDMAGNVLEWCWDWYDTFFYGASPETDPHGPSYGRNSLQSMRGGSWKSNAYTCRSTYRVWRYRDNDDNDTGFRTVLPAGQ